jgi:hypothetical protein
MDIDHIFTAYKRPLTVIAIQGYVYKIMNKMFKRSINKNKHDTKKQQLMPPPCVNACLIKETTGFISSGVHGLRMASNLCFLFQN